MACRLRLVVLALVLLLAALVDPNCSSVPMNADAVGGRGGTYKIANPPPGESAYVNTSRHAHRGEFIEVYSENISTHYGEVCRSLCARR